MAVLGATVGLAGHVGDEALEGHGIQAPGIGDGLEVCLTNSRSRKFRNNSAYIEYKTFFY